MGNVVKNEFKILLNHLMWQLTAAIHKDWLVFDQEYSYNIPKVGKSGLKENPEFLTGNTGIVVAFMCAHLVNTII